MILPPSTLSRDAQCLVGRHIDRVFCIGGYPTLREEEKSGEPLFFLQGRRYFSIGFQFKFLLWNTAQNLRILKAVCDALPTDELRALSGELDLGKDAWPEFFGNHKDLRHVHDCSLPILRSLIPFLARERVYPKLVSLTLHGMDLNPKCAAAVLSIDGLEACSPPMSGKICIENCRWDLVDLMKAAVPDVVIAWDCMELSK